MQKAHSPAGREQRSKSPNLTLLTSSLCTAPPMGQARGGESIGAVPADQPRHEQGRERGSRSCQGHQETRCAPITGIGEGAKAQQLIRKDQLAKPEPDELSDARSLILTSPC